MVAQVVYLFDEVGVVLEIRMQRIVVVRLSLRSIGKPRRQLLQM